MPEIVLITRDNARNSVEFTPGATPMQPLYNAGSDNSFGPFGVMLSCASSPVYVDQRDYPLAVRKRVGNNSLEMSTHRGHNSRLSFQIAMTAEFGAVRVTVVPAD